MIYKITYLRCYKIILNGISLEYFYDKKIKQLCSLCPSHWYNSFTVCTRCYMYFSYDIISRLRDYTLKNMRDRREMQIHILLAFAFLAPLSTRSSSVGADKWWMIKFWTESKRHDYEGHSWSCRCFWTRSRKKRNFASETCWHKCLLFWKTYVNFYLFILFEICYEILHFIWFLFK